jgi:hypothetical protein
MSAAEMAALTASSLWMRDGACTISVGYGSERSQPKVAGVSGAVACRSVHGHRPFGAGAGASFGASGSAACPQCPQQERGFGVSTLAGAALARHSMTQHQPGGNTRITLHISTRKRAARQNMSRPFMGTRSKLDSTTAVHHAPTAGGARSQYTTAKRPSGRTKAATRLQTGTSPARPRSGVGMPLRS